MKAECEKQWGNWLYGGGFKKSSRKDVEKDLARIQEVKSSTSARVEEVRRKADEIRKRADEDKRLNSESLRRITENYRMLHKPVKVGLICPVCGAGNRVKVGGVTYINNMVNGQPWCAKCKVALVEVDKAEKWVDIKQGNMDDVMRRLRGLP